MNKMKETNYQNNSSCMVAQDDNCPIVLDKEKNLLYRLVPNAGMFGFHLECFENEKLLWRDHLSFKDFEKISKRNQEVFTK